MKRQFIEKTPSFDAPSDAIRRGLADAAVQLKDKHDALMNELIRRAMEQNPDLTAQLRAVKEEEETIHALRRRERIRIYKEWQERETQEHIASRKTRYDDRRNPNALNGLRRSLDYKYAETREQQIRMELDYYYKPRGIEPPKELVEELERLNPLPNPESKAGQNHSPSQ